MMNTTKLLLKLCVLASMASSALGHEGHGVPGTFSHDLQHQLWTFAALVVTGALLLNGDRIAALVVGVAKVLRAAASGKSGQSDYGD
jgi:hypothetical protein